MTMMSFANGGVIVRKKKWNNAGLHEILGVMAPNLLVSPILSIKGVVKSYSPLVSEHL